MQRRGLLWTWSRNTHLPWAKAHLKWKTGLLSSYNPPSHKNETAFIFQMSNSWSAQLPDVYGLLVKEEGMLHSYNHGLDPTFLRHPAAIKFKMSFSFLEFVLFTQFKHLIHFICSTLNKIWVYEIWKSLHSVFIYTLHSVPTFLEVDLRLLCMKDLYCFSGWEESGDVTYFHAPIETSDANVMTAVWLISYFQSNLRFCIIVT